MNLRILLDNKEIEVYGVHYHNLNYKIHEIVIKYDLSLKDIIQLIKNVKSEFEKENDAVGL
jgi:hypothetical protein